MDFPTPILQNQERPASVESFDQNFDQSRSICRSHQNQSSRHGSWPNERGQVVLEYVLLLVASVVIALLITRMMVGRDPGNPGFVISAWNSIVDEIGADYPDDIRR